MNITKQESIKIVGGFLKAEIKLEDGIVGTIYILRDGELVATIDSLEEARELHEIAEFFLSKFGE